MIALDLDGTLLDYSPEGPTPRVNRALIATLKAQGVRQVAILTNQGGLPFGVAGKLRKDVRPYPTPEQFDVRLGAAVYALARSGIAVVAVRVSCWHQYARERDIQSAARQVRALMPRLSTSDWRVYATARARKPNPLMLRSVGATCYYGDSPEDGDAAANAGIPFVKVERFL